MIQTVAFFSQKKEMKSPKELSRGTAYLLIFSSVQATPLTTIAVLLAAFGFAFFFVGRKSTKEDKTLKILGWLDLLSTLSIIILYVIVFFAIAN